MGVQDKLPALQVRYYSHTSSPLNHADRIKFAFSPVAYMSSFRKRKRTGDHHTCAKTEPPSYLLMSYSY